LVPAGVPLVLALVLVGPAQAARAGARVLAAVATGACLLATTAPADRERALAWLGLPRALVELVGLAQRQAAALEGALRTARDAQALRLGHVGVRRRLRSVGVLGGLLVARAVDRTDQIAAAQAMRGYLGEPKRGPWPAARAQDAALLVVGALLLWASALGSFEGWS
jgi:cobalt/nickel transport system permease protein